MNKKNPLFASLIGLVLITSLALSSCSMPTATVVPGALATPTLEGVTLATPTLDVVLDTPTPGSGASDTPTTPSAESSETPTTVATATNTPVSATTFTPTSTPAAGCDVAEFVTDVTYPDDSNVKANSDIIKTWRVKNTGSCTWDSNYKLVFIRGEQLNGPSPAVIISGGATPSSTVTPASTGAPSSTATPVSTGAPSISATPVAPVPSGSIGNLSVPMKAPVVNGTHFGVWQLYNAAGKPVLMKDGTPLELTIKIIVTDGTGGKVTSIHGWVYSYVGVKCGANVQYDVSTTIYADGPVNVNYVWSASNGLLTVVTQNYVFGGPGNINVTTHLSPPFANPNDIRLTITANGVSSSFTICP